MNEYQFFELLKGYWAIDEQYAMLHWGSVVNFLSGKFRYEELPEPEAYKPFALNESSEIKSTYDKAPVGSIAIIPVMGVMTKHDQYCGPVGTATIAKRFKAAEEHKNISAIIMHFDTGGGATSSINPLEDVLVNRSKPVVSFFDETLGSAGFIAGWNADEIIGSHDMAQIGSLGVMANFIDRRPVAEKEGVVFRKVYSDYSPKKNLPIENFLKGDDKLLRDKELNPLALEAINKLKKLRGHKITDEAVYEAEMFFAKDALIKGIIDGIGNMEFAVKRATEIAKTWKKPEHSATASLHTANYETVPNITSSEKISNTNISSEKKFIETKVSTTSKKSKIINSNKNIAMNERQIPALLFALGLNELQSVDDKFHLSAEQVKTIQDYFASNFGTHVTFTGASFDDDASGNFTKKGLQSLNAVLTKAMATRGIDASKAGQDKITEMQKAHDDKLAEMQTKIDKLSDEGESIDLSGVEGEQVSDFRKNATGVNAIGPDRPWNAAALAIAEGRRHEIYAFQEMGATEEHIDTFIADYKKADSSIDIEQMNEELGAFHRETDSEIKDMLVANEQITKLFPWRSTGTKDTLTSISSYISNHLQPRNAGEWASKGTNEFQAESDKLKPWQVTRTYLKEEMFQFMESWLATKTKGTDPYQESFVSWFISQMLKQIALVERPLNAIRVSPQKSMSNFKA